MRQRSFEIIRKPELAKTSFLFNNVEVTYVGTCPETGISFYCSLEHNYGVRFYPNGQKVLVNATTVNKGYAYVHGKADYLQFKNAFGTGKHILASHAVWMAAGRSIPPGFTIDHINGCTTNNSLGNLRCIDINTNLRDGGFLAKLRNKGYNPVKIQRSFLLRYYTRMAVIKPALKRWRYYALNANDLDVTLYWSDEAVMLYYLDRYNIKITFNHANDIAKLRRLMRTAHVLQKGDDDHKFGQSLALKQAWWFESFRDALSNGFARFTYYKKDGTTRTALGTRAPSLIPVDKAPKALPEGVWEATVKAFPYFDLDKNEWRSFSVLNFISLDRVWRFNDPLA